MVQSYHSIPPPSHTPYVCSITERTAEDVKMLCQPGQSIPAKPGETGESGETGMGGMYEGDHVMTGDTPWFEDYESELKVALEMEEEQARAKENGMEIENEWKPYQDEVGNEWRMRNEGWRMKNEE